MKRILILSVFLTGLFSCSEEEKINDPIYEFVSFKGQQSVNLNEKLNSTIAFPVVAQLLAFKPYSEDISLTLEITGENAVENVDFIIIPNATLKIKAGALLSDTLFIKTIDNEVGTDKERRIEIKIKSISKPEIKIGLGIQEPKNASVLAKILDDECSKTVSIYSSSNLSNAISWGTGGKTTTVSGAISGPAVTVTGDLIGYSPFSSASLTLTLNPAAPGSKGKATFGEQETGADSDGYEYKFIEVGQGSYDLCSGTIQVKYDIYYLDGTDWAYWYTATNTITVP